MGQRRRVNEETAEWVVLLPISIFFKLIEGLCLRWGAGSARVSFLYNKLNKFISTNLFFPQTNMPCRRKKKGGSVLSVSHKSHTLRKFLPAYGFYIVFFLSSFSTRICRLRACRALSVLRFSLALHANFPIVKRQEAASPLPLWIAIYALAI